MTGAGDGGGELAVGAGGGEEGWRGEARAGVTGVDREWGEVAGDPGKERDLSLRDGAPPGRPLTAEW